MARFRRAMALRPVNRIKHIVDQSATITAGTALTVNLALATDTPTLANTAGVETGSKINGIYLKIEVASNEAQDVGAIPNVYMAVVKNPGGNITFSGISTLGDDDNKRFVIHQEMLMIDNKLGGNPRTLFNGVIVIPKLYRRMAPNDSIQILIFSPALNIAECLQCHYKEFR